MNKLIIANWKMNPQSLEEAVALAEATDHEGLVIAPPFPYLSDVGKVLKKSELGAQDMFWEEKGAYTGEVSSGELKSLGLKYVIVGHSERRKHLGETDEMIAKKMVAALGVNLIPILCVGETREERDQGKGKEVIKRELEIGLSLVASGYTLNPIIAYEPIWAISTEKNAKACSPEDAVEMITFIRNSLITNGQPLVARCIYGGSVGGENAESFLEQEEIGGALVGGASLKPEEMKKIMQAASQHSE